MALGPPQVSIDGLNELAVVLKLLGTNQASGARSRLRRRGREDVRIKSRYREPIQLGLDLGHRIPQNPLGANPKGLIQALADLLLEAAGVETVQTSGGDHECQDHA